MLASILARKGDLDGAADQAKQGIAADPKNIQARATLAQIYVNQKNLPQAEATLRKTVDDLPESSQAVEALQNFYAATHQVDRFEPVFSDLLARHPKSVPIKLAYTRLELAKKETQPKGRTLLAELMKSDPNDANVALLNGMVLLSDGKSSDAFDFLQKATKNNPDNFQIKLWLARAAVAKGDMNTAQQDFQDAARLNPSSFEVQEALAGIAKQRRDNSTLAQIAEKSMTIAPKSALPYLWRGQAEAAQNQIEKAEADFVQASKVDPNNSDAYLALAQIRLTQKKIPEATTLLEKALTLNPNSDNAPKSLSRLTSTTSTSMWLSREFRPRSSKRLRTARSTSNSPSFRS